MKLHATVERIQMFTDGSGAPALISAGPCRWSFDFIGGEVRSHTASDTAWVARKLRTASHTVATAAYAALVSHPEFIARNLAMYA